MPAEFTSSSTSAAPIAIADRETNNAALCPVGHSGGPARLEPCSTGTTSRDLKSDAVLTRTFTTSLSEPPLALWNSSTFLLDGAARAAWLSDDTDHTAATGPANPAPASPETPVIEPSTRT